MQKDKLIIKVKNGIVILKGEVESEDERTSIRKFIEEIEGVQGIVDKVKIAPALSINMGGGFS